VALDEFLRVLPAAVQQQVDGYVRFVDDISSELFAEQQVRRPSDAQHNTLLTMAAAWKLWRLVDSQYWILSNSLDLLRESDVHEVAIGSSRYSRSSGSFRSLGTLRSQLAALLAQLDLGDLTDMYRLSDADDPTASDSSVRPCAWRVI
jgi:hypothetical protein